MEKKIVLFDVDGTIFNSYPGIRHCAKYAIDKLGFSIEDEKFRLFVGPPLINSFIKYTGMSFEQAFEAVEIFRKEYKRIGNQMFEVYDGVYDCLDKLNLRGKLLGTATSKPEIMADIMFEKVGIKKFFKHIVGSTMDGTKEEKIDIIRDAITRFEEEDINKYVLIGDTIFDYEAAEAIGMDCIIVKYGFGNQKLYEMAKYKVEEPKDILSIIY